MTESFGWAPADGVPRITFVLDGKDLKVGEQTVMQFNKCGRDGFPIKVNPLPFVVPRLW